MSSRERTGVKAQKHTLLIRSNKFYSFFYISQIELYIIIRNSKFFETQFGTQLETTIDLNPNENRLGILKFKKL